MNQQACIHSELDEKVLYEYAIDPESDPNTLWCALSQFGVHFGRILCECPPNFRKKLRKAIYTAAGADEIERDMLISRFERMLDQGWFVRRPASDFDASQENWISRILPEHNRDPFRAMIWSGEKNRDDVLTRLDLHDENPYWFVDQTPVVARTAGAIANALGPLGKISADLLFVDPFFGEKPHDFSSIPEIIRVSHCDHMPLQRVEIHTVHEANNTKRKRVDEIKKSVAHALGTEFRSAIPRQFKIRVCIWETAAGGDDFHDRYILTNLGGVGISLGLDVGSGDRLGSHKNTIFRLSPRLYQRRKDQFDTESVAFKRRTSSGLVDYKLVDEFSI
jgi:hypothetical protein